MKSNQLIIGFLAIAVAVFLAGVVYKVTHKGGGRPPVQAPAPASTPAPTVAVSRPTPAPPPPPTAPATTINPNASKGMLQTGHLSPIFYIQAKMRMLKTGVTAALNRRSVTLDDFDKLDFAPVASTDPYNVFNPNGKIAYKPNDGAWIDQALVDAVTTKKGTPLVYNLRRTTEPKGTLEVLYAMIPNISPKACGVAAGNKDYSSRVEIGIEADNHTIVDDPPGMPAIEMGCLHTPGNKIVWMYQIKLRFMRNGDDRWGSSH
ncbi:MAG: hypothetical protein EPN97_04400 [Alphaproteobacteria bacterium]|nr:MAG: hypothetical protein EPN97_04400 [Alphaproteobacteria bacterium]